MLTIELSYKLATRSFCGATLVGSEHDGSVESVEQSGRTMSEPTQFCDSIRHQDGFLEFELKFELEFEYGLGSVELELVFEYGAEPEEVALPFPEGSWVAELDPEFKHAMFKPSKNLPAIVSAGIILPYAAMVSVAHLSCTSDHHFWVDWTQSAVQRSVTLSVVQR